jgi:glycine hydroxymethyltransferase
MHSSRRDFELNRLLDEHESFRRQSVDLLAGASIPTAATRQAVQRMEMTRGVEGTVGKRFISDGLALDGIESLAMERAKKVFGFDYANVQVASGTQANNAVLNGLCEQGSLVLAMDLVHGGHLSHGHPCSQAGRFYNIKTYGVEETSHLIDYDRIRGIALREHPRLIIAGSSSYPRNINYGILASIASEVGAILLLDISHPAGFFACGFLQLPIMPHVVITLTTYKTLCGPRGALISASLDLAPHIERAVFPGVQGSVCVASISGKAAVLGDTSRIEYKEFQGQILQNAQLISSTFAEEGLDMVASGTDNHLVIVDLSRLGRSGRGVEEALRNVGIIANRQMIPYDPFFPKDMSGVRFGATTVTIQGIEPDELRCLCRLIAGFIHSGKMNELTSRTISAIANSLNTRPMHSLFNDKKFIDELRTTQGCP